MATSRENREKAQALCDQILYRRSADIISGAATKPVRAGWAMGHFYEPGHPAFSTAFEIKEWGGTDHPSTFNIEWGNHPNNGPEYLHVLWGELHIFFGFRDEEGRILQLDLGPSVTLRAGDTAIVPPNLHRRYEASSDVRGITVRASPSKPASR